MKVYIAVGEDSDQHIYQAYLVNAASSDDSLGYYNYTVSSVSSTGDGRYKDESSGLCRVRAGSLSCGTELEGRIV